MLLWRCRFVGGVFLGFFLPSQSVVFGGGKETAKKSDRMVCVSGCYASQREVHLHRCEGSSVLVAGDLCGLG